ncbi:hypothetical protein Aca07nite_33390 [Actinoplanes capillaceus]|uniref:Uncharacterized protein n=1 Tax=Actinoplanes campanulatus TaxID=113559 RepID=A0ABQ3WIK1_9ACTN|nr:hypothetical protein Aca07nite_33390 [Actinoplanes capillaceus]
MSVNKRIPVRSVAHREPLPDPRRNAPAGAKRWFRLTLRLSHGGRDGAESRPGLHVQIAGRGRMEDLTFPVTCWKQSFPWVRSGEEPPAGKG